MREPQPNASEKNGARKSHFSSPYSSPGLRRFSVAFVFFDRDTLPKQVSLLAGYIWAKIECFLLSSFRVYHLPRSTRRGGGLAVIARKGFQVTENEGCMFSTFEHFDLAITSGNKVFRLVTVYRPPPSRKKMVLQ